MSRTILPLLLALGLCLLVTRPVSTEPAATEPAARPSELEETVAFLASAIKPDEETIDYLTKIDLRTGLVPKPGESTEDYADAHGRHRPPDALCALGCDIPQHLAVSANGRTVAAGRRVCAPSITLCDRVTGRGLRWIWEGGDVSALAMSRDGKLLAAAVCRSGTNRRTQGRVYLWDIASRQQISDFALILPAMSVAFLPDGESLVVGDEDGLVTQWSIETGDKLRQLGTHNREVSTVAVSPDGRSVASGSFDGSVRIWELETGKERRRLTHPHDVQFVTFSPDGRHLAAVSGSLFSFGQTHVWDLVTGKELPHFAHHPPAARGIDFSPNGRLLASTSKDGIHLWEIASGLERRRLDRTVENYWGSYATTAFAPDGRTVIGGGYRTWVWDVTGRSPDGQLPDATFTPAGLESLWEDLGSRDPATAHAAIWALTAARQDAVPLLGKRLPPAEAVDLDRIQRWIADLDDDQFDTRQRASQELEKADDVRVAELLVKLLADKPALEVQRRAERVLIHATGAGHPERIRGLRVLEVLEQIGTAGARDALARLAKGAPASHLTRAAQAALERVPGPDR